MQEVASLKDMDLNLDYLSMIKIFTMYNFNSRVKPKKTEIKNGDKTLMKENLVNIF